MNAVDASELKRSLLLFVGESMSKTIPKTLKMLSDSDLIEDFKINRDPGSFDEIVRRYSSLVFGVCFRVTANRHDAEDAFQATFMVLAKSAAKIKDSNAVSNWLYGVAYRVSIRLSKQRAKGKMCDAEHEIAIADDPFENVNNKFIHQKTDEALHGLPEKLRTPMVMRYILGKSNSEVASELDLSVSTVEGRLKRAKSRLRLSLTKNGITLGSALIGIAACQHECEAEVTSSLLDSVSATELLGNDSTGTEALADVSKLALEEVYSMSALPTLKFASLFTACSLMLVAGAGIPIATGLAGVGEGRDEDSNPFGVTIQAEPKTKQVTEVEVAVTEFENAVANANPRNPGQQRIENEFDNRVLNHSESKILNELKQDTQLDFFEETLGGVLSYFRDLHGIQIEIDQKSLDEVGIATDQVVQDRSLKGIPLQDALELILDELDLTFTMKNRVLLITSVEAAEQNVETRVYNYDSKLPVSLEELQEIIVHQVSPSSWEEVGGSGALTVFKTGMVIRQTFRVHMEIHELLSQLQTNAKKSSN